MAVTITMPPGRLREASTVVVWPSDAVAQIGRRIAALQALVVAKTGSARRPAACGRSRQTREAALWMRNVVHLCFAVGRLWRSSSGR